MTACTRHEHTPPLGSRSFLITFLLNGLFAIFETLMAYKTNSSSLLADAGHNFSDVLSIAMAWWAHYLLQHTAQSKYSFGYKKVTILSALFNAILLLITGVWILQDVLAQFLNPQLHSTTIVALTAFCGALINGLTAIFFYHQQHDLNQKALFTHLLYDAVTSLAVVLTILLIGFTHWVRLDAIVGLIIVSAIVYSGIIILKEGLHLLLAGTPFHIDIEAVKKDLLRLEGIEEIHDLHIWALSTREIALTVHLVSSNLHWLEEHLPHLQTHLEQNFGIHHSTIQLEANPTRCRHQYSCDVVR